MRRVRYGLGPDEQRFVFHRYGLERNGRLAAGIGRRLRMRVKNDHHVVTIAGKRYLTSVLAPTTRSPSRAILRTR